MLFIFIFFGCAPSPKGCANELGKVFVIPVWNLEIFKPLEQKGFGFVSFEEVFIKNKMPLNADLKPIVVVSSTLESFVFTSEAKTNLLPYDVDYDPDKIFVCSSNEVSVLLKAAETQDYFISDGRTNIICIPEGFENKVKAYAPAEGLKIAIATGEAFQYPTKKQAHKDMRTSGDGLYVTYPVATTRDFLNKVLVGAKASGLDTLVVDFKESYAKYFIENGLVSLEAMEQTKQAKFFKQLVKNLQAQGFFVVARIVVFKDFGLANTRLDLTIKDKNTGRAWCDRSGAPWMDPYSYEVRKYNVDLAELAIRCGFDEVQFDYIRFPTEGKMSDCIFPHQQPGQKREDAITYFLNEVAWRLKPYNKPIAVDIFGVVLWGSGEDQENLGQNIARMAEYVDVICPMLYPSHFHYGYDGFKRPGDEPYYFNYTGCKKLKDLLKKVGHEEVKVVPWLQGFAYKAPSFGSAYVLTEIKAAKDAGAEGYLIWNAGNRYEVSFSALGSKN